MALIEGLGDEVTVFFFAILVCILVGLAWISTGVADLAPIRIIVLDRARFQEFLRRFTNRNTRAQISDSPIPIRSEQSAVETNSVPLEPSTLTQDSASLPSDNVHVNTSTESSRGTCPTLDSSKTPSLSQTQAQSGDARPSPSADINIDAVSVEPTEISQEVLDSFLSSTRTCGSAVDGASVDDVQDVKKQDTSAVPDDKDSNSESKESETQPPVQSDDVTTTGNDTSNTDSTTLPPGDAEENQPLAEGHIRIRLKYLDERQKLVQARPEETIAAFKRKHFAVEMADNFKVRFIHRGSELREERSTLQANRIEDNSVIHCLLSRISQSEQPIQQQENFDLGFLMIPLFGLILGVMWYCRFTYRSYFSAMSTLSLMGISFLFFVAVLAFFRRGVHEHED